MKILKSASPLHLQFTLCAPLTLTLLALQAPAQAQQAEGFMSMKKYETSQSRWVTTPAGVASEVYLLNKVHQLLGSLEKGTLTRGDVEKFVQGGAIRVDLRNNRDFNKFWREKYAVEEFRALTRARNEYAEALDRYSKEFSPGSRKENLKSIWLEKRAEVERAVEALEQSKSKLRSSQFWASAESQKLKVYLNELAVNAERTLLKKHLAGGIANAILLIDVMSRVAIFMDGRNPGWSPMITEISTLVK